MKTLNIDAELCEILIKKFGFITRIDSIVFNDVMYFELHYNNIHFYEIAGLVAFCLENSLVFSLGSDDNDCRIISIYKPQ